MNGSSTRSGRGRRAERTRREFLGKSAGALLAGLGAPHILGARERVPGQPASPNERAGIAAVGVRYQGTVITSAAMEFGDVVAIGDVDRQHAEKAKRDLGGKADLYGDYRKMLERKDIDVVTIATPDHWHTAIAIAACQAGKDVYCEKPLTLTVEEGKLLCRVVRETGRVFQVGSWQRSDHRFRLACEMVRAGRIGRLRRVQVVLKENVTGGPFRNESPPPHLDWEMWLGQTPEVPYCKERCHYTFRWWYEYSGGQMTDWGAHNIDIAQWGMGAETTGPVEIDGRATFPDVPNGYNVATSYEARLVYADGVEMRISDSGQNGVTFVGEKGEIFVNRATISSKPAALLEDDPLPREKFRLYANDNLSRPPRVRKGPATQNHMGNFFDCIGARKTPISDVVSQHRTVSTCHVANISMRLGRPLRWDPARERFVGDDEANRWLRREQRKRWEIRA